MPLSGGSEGIAMCPFQVRGGRERRQKEGKGKASALLHREAFFTEGLR